MNELVITVLGSGSSGNAVLLSLGNSAILIDAGFSRKELLRRLSLRGIDPSIIKGLLITHEHKDHVSGARLLSDYLDIPVFANRHTFQAMESASDKKVIKKKSIFNTGEVFKLESFTIKTFKISHDSVEPIGFIISANNLTIGYAMDLGYLDNVSTSRLRGCNTIILESNHDTKMLLNSNRPPGLKHRISGRQGHLSNDQAMEAFHELITTNTKTIFLGHLSSECNNHSLVAKLTTAKLKQLGRGDISFHLMKQNEPLPHITVS